jgi:large subunit ribosomal protein L4
MLKLAVRNHEGKKVDEVELKAGVFEVKANEAVVHQVVRAQLAAKRKGLASTRSRGEVHGGGRKPWRQKGTGRARAGSNRSPLWKGGGTVFGPSPRNYSVKVPKKVKTLALKMVLSAKAKASELTVIEGWSFEEPKTKKALEVIQNLKVNGKILVVLSKWDENVEKSLRNIPGVKVILAAEMNVLDVLDNSNLVIEREALSGLVEALA